VDAPEANGSPEYYGQQAWQANRQLVQGKTVTLVSDPAYPDGNDPLMRYVIAGEVFVNEALIRQGYARLAASASTSSCWQQLQDAADYAEGNLVGMWKPTATAPPPPTNTPVTPQPTQPPRCGAICSDDTKSCATGAGACSSHGGVKEWLYVGDPRCPSCP
jgi:endonuclease YncB( thermonuclease family)